MTGEENGDDTDELLRAIVDGRRDLIALADGSTLTTHGRAQCQNDTACCIHSPSQHPLRTAPLAWSDLMKIMFRMCEHQSLHPDPDALAHYQLLAFLGRRVPYDGWHECCPQQCCIGPEGQE